jgi:signal transduction histidine kinase
MTIALVVPYILLFALLGVVGLVWWRAVQDEQTAKRTQAANKRAEALAEQKEGFMVLVSHYIRTVAGQFGDGADIAASVKASNDIADAILAKANGQRLATDPTAGVPPLHAWWKAPIFFMSVGLIGFWVILSDTLLVMTNQELSVVSIITQVSFFIALAIGLMLGVQTKLARARERAIASRQADRLRASDGAMNNYIAEMAVALRQKLETISSTGANLDGEAKQQFTNTCARMEKVIKHFGFASSVTLPAAIEPFKPFRFSVLLAQAQATVSQAAYDKQVSIIPGGLEDITLASPQTPLIVQVLTSLLENAVAASQEGSQVQVDAAAKGAMGMVRVIDNGQGLSPDKIAELFQPFSQAKPDESDASMSIYLNRLLATALGGELHMAAQPNQGTSVTLNFPIQ